jgi:hypothetical protein
LSVKRDTYSMTAGLIGPPPGEFELSFRWYLKS